MSQLLLAPITEETRKEIVSTFFDTRFDSIQVSLWQDYLEYYERELRRLCIGVLQPYGTIPYLATEEHKDILYVCNVLCHNKNMPKRQIREALRPQFPQAGDLAIERSIDLTIRLWLMLNVRDDSSTVQMPQKTPIEWDDDVSLDMLIANQFSISTLHLDPRQRRLDPSFTAANMVKLCGLELKWTDSLEDHLRLNRRSKELWIFPYKDFLSRHLDSTKENITNRTEIFPQSLLRETITTLNLLFPQWDPSTETLLSKHRQSFHTIAPFAGPRRLDLYEFSYWRDQLFELYEEIYLAPADSWRQLWLDRRNPLQWYTFWVAVVILILSIVSCVTSIVQAWASIVALRLQIASTSNV